MGVGVEDAKPKCVLVPKCKPLFFSQKGNSVSKHLRVKLLYGCLEADKEHKNQKT